MPRPKADGVRRRVLLRVRPDLLGLFDGYSTTQLSELMNQALTELTVSNPLGARQASIIRPQEIASHCMARITIDNNTVRILFPEKSEDFRRIVKSRHKFRWDSPFWSREFRDGEICDRSAEVAHALLQGGFIVQSEYSGITRLAVEGSYQPEALRMIRCRDGGIYDGWLAVDWPRVEDFYDKAMAITGAKYADKSVLVPPEMYEELEDFAEINDFSFSQAALDSMQQIKDSVALGFVPSRIKARKQRAARQSESQGIPEALLDD